MLTHDPGRCSRISGGAPERLNRNFCSFRIISPNMTIFQDPSIESPGVPVSASSLRCRTSAEVFSHTPVDGGRRLIVMRWAELPRGLMIILAS
jgi:hypothetical protein